jgi:hypothetical protein
LIDNNKKIVKFEDPELTSHLPVAVPSQQAYSPPHQETENNESLDEQNKSNKNQSMHSISEPNENNTQYITEQEYDDEIDDDTEIKCPCKEHLGKELVNLKVNLPVDYLFECLIVGNEFTEQFQKVRKIWGKKFFHLIK